MRRHQGAKVKHFDVSNVIYHKFSHGAVSYTLNGENVNVMLEYYFINASTSHFIKTSQFEVYFIGYVLSLFHLYLPETANFDSW